MRAILLIIVVVAAAAVSTSGQTLDVTLEGKMFSPLEATVKDGDTIRICNKDSFYHSPFSYSKHNRFGTPKGIRLAPGDCTTLVARNPTSKSIPFKIFDELHSFEKLTIKVLPADGSDDGALFGEEDDSGPKGQPACNASEQALWSKISGAWEASYGPVTFSGSCENVTGHWKQGEWGEKGDKLRGEIKDGRVSGSSLTFNYSQSWNDKSGSDSCYLSADGKKLECSYLERLQR